MIEFWESLQIAEPFWAFGILVLPMIFWLEKKLNQKSSTILFPTISILKDSIAFRSSRWVWVPKLLRYLALVFLLLSLCRPQLDQSTTSIATSGVDIVLAVDISGSMRERDMRPSRNQEATRLDVVKGVLQEFIVKRKHDRLGLIAFAEKPYICSPILLNKTFITDRLNELEVLADDIQTRLVSGIALGIKLLQNLTSKSKIIIILSDGHDTVDYHPPLVLADKAKKEGIKIYTIAFGSSFSNDVDEKTLREIAEITGATFYRADDKESLKSIYSEINELEKSEVEMVVDALYEDLYIWPLSISILLLVTEFFLARTRYLRIP